MTIEQFDGIRPEAALFGFQILEKDCIQTLVRVSRNTVVDYHDYSRRHPRPLRLGDYLYYK
jgi:hypothetical protein